ncbi:MAG TPA: cytochrome C551 [Bacteroidales bacterium]|nr:MAG: cytochrome C551 [Bacteroidetes bacterium GWF2_33_38]OFY73092.1 MAG: cytochrome C551 [Bacteroidetes bacterium RIFOXYA12_FULL_33_9]HBF88630.1 cytochrome C551 [Bacteroidales bacterium]
MEKPVIADKKPIIMDMEAGTYYWCACGKSKKQPFCDGSHKGSSFVPLKVEISENKKVAWCTCKQTQKPPFCDGSHRNL